MDSFREFMSIYGLALLIPWTIMGFFGIWRCILKSNGYDRWRAKREFFDPDDCFWIMVEATLLGGLWLIVLLFTKTPNRVSDDG